MEADETELFLQQANCCLSTKLKEEAMTLAECFKQQGFERGIQQGEIRMITTLLRHRFGDIPANYIDAISKADTQTLLQWGQKVLEATTLEEIFC